MGIKIESEYAHNNGQTGYGKFYVAKLTGTDPKFTFKREFLNKVTEYNNSAKTTWYSFTVEIESDGLYELVESNLYKSKQKYFEVKDGKVNYFEKVEMLDKVKILK